MRLRTTTPIGRQKEDMKEEVNGSTIMNREKLLSLRKDYNLAHGEDNRSPLFTVRNKATDMLHRFPFLKAQLTKLPKIFWPKPKPYGLVLALNEHGKIIRSLHDDTGEHLKEITSARDVQLEEMDSGFGPMKSKNFANSISNVVVSADEILPIIDQLEVRVDINGKKVVESDTSGIYYSLPEAIAYA